MKRKVEIAVISDIHLGTYGCHANELLQYLKEIEPKTLILNGDIIDIWQFSKSYFPAAHMQVVRAILDFATKGTKVYYITGNHDELFRKFSGFELGNLSLVNKVILELNGKKAWFFHGDVFDITMKQSKWLAKLGSKGYDLLILLNRFINFILVKFGREKLSLSKKIKNSVKSAVSFISNFENTAMEIAADQNFDYVLCGHIHQPIIKDVEVKGKSIKYLNSGDWVENLTSLEYNEGSWTLYKHEEIEILNKAEELIELEKISDKNILVELMKEFRMF